MTRCTVAVCANNAAATKKREPPVSYHRFPKNPHLRKVWVERCHRAGVWNPDSCHICSDHFTSKDFVDDVRSRIMGLPKRNVLKGDAIPSRNLQEKKDVTQVSNKKESYSGRLRKQLCSEASTSNLEESKLITEELILDLKEEPMDEEREETDVSQPYLNLQKECLKASTSNQEETNTIVKKEEKDEWDETFWENPRYASLQGYLEEKNCLTKICRICLEAFENGGGQILTSDATNSQAEFQNKVKLVLPDIDLNVFSSSFVCNKCIKLVDYSVELQEKWRSSQKRLDEIFDRKRFDNIREDDIIIAVDPPTRKTNESDDTLTSSLINVSTIPQEVITTEAVLLPDRDVEMQPELNFKKISEFETPTMKRWKPGTKERCLNIICSVCQQVFSSIEHYVGHTPNHIETKNKCFRCRKRLRNADQLLSHLIQCLDSEESVIDSESNQENYAKYVCRICNKKFVFLHNLDQHVESCSKNEVG